MLHNEARHYSHTRKCVATAAVRQSPCHLIIAVGAAVASIGWFSIPDIVALPSTNHHELPPASCWYHVQSSHSKGKKGIKHCHAWLCFEGQLWFVILGADTSSTVSPPTVILPNIDEVNPSVAQPPSPSKTTTPAPTAAPAITVAKATAVGIGIGIDKPPFTASIPLLSLLLVMLKEIMKTSLRTRICMALRGSTRGCGHMID